MYSLALKKSSLLHHMNEKGILVTITILVTTRDLPHPKENRNVLCFCFKLKAHCKELANYIVIIYIFAKEHEIIVHES